MNAKARATDGGNAVALFCFLCLLTATPEVRAEERDPSARLTSYQQFLARSVPLGCRFSTESQWTEYLRRGATGPAGAQDLVMSDWDPRVPGTWFSDGFQWRLDREARIVLSDGTLTAGMSPETLRGAIQIGDPTASRVLPQNIILRAGAKGIAAVFKHAHVDPNGRWRWTDPEDNVSYTIELGDEEPSVPSLIQMDYPGDARPRVVIRVMEWTEEPARLPRRVVREHSAIVGGKRVALARQRALFTNWRVRLAEDPFIIHLPDGFRLEHADGSVFTVGAAPGGTSDELVPIHVRWMMATAQGRDHATRPVDFRSLSQFGFGEGAQVSSATRSLCGEVCVVGILAWHGKVRSVQEIAEQHSPEEFMSLREMRDALARHGVEADWRKVPVGRLSQLNEPFVVQVKTRASPGTHFLLATALMSPDAAGDKLVVYDHPYPPTVVRTSTIERRALSILVIGDDLDRFESASAGPTLGILLAVFGILLVLVGVRLAKGRRAPVALVLALLLFGCGGSPQSLRVVVVPSAVIDLGPVLSGSAVTVPFDIENRSDEATYPITKVVSTCGCLAVDTGAESIGAGATLRMSARLRLRGAGPRVEHARVLLGDHGSVSIRFSALVVPDIELNRSPPQIVGAAEAMSRVDLLVRVFWPVTDQAGSLRVRCRSLHLDESVPVRGSYEYRQGLSAAEVPVALDVPVPPRSRGRVTHRLELSCRFGRAVIPIVVRAEGAYELVPASLRLQSGTTGRTLVLVRAAATDQETLAGSIDPPDGRTLNIRRVGPRRWEIDVAADGFDRPSQATVVLQSSVHPPIRIPLLERRE